MRPAFVIESKKKTQPLLPLNRSKTNIQAKVEKIKFSLTKEEEKIYGDRFPAGYKKQKILGRGGCALVWLGEELETGKRLAIKQISRLSGSNAIESCKREVHFGTMLKEFSSQACDSIIKLVDSRFDKQDSWAFFEVGGGSLSKALFQVRGEFVKSERIYRIEHPPLYEHFTCIDNLRCFMRDLLKALIF